MNWQKALAGLAVLVVFVLAVIVLWPAPAPREDATVNEANTLILRDLGGLGLQDVLVDVTDSQVLVRYNEPPGFANRSAVLAIAASYAPLTERVVVQVFDNFEPKKEFDANTSVVLGYLDGEISEDELLSSVSTLQLS